MIGIAVDMQALLYIAIVWLGQNISDRVGALEVVKNNGKWLLTIELVLLDGGYTYIALSNLNKEIREEKI